MRNNKKQILIIGKNSYVGNSFGKHIESAHSDENWQVDLVGASDEEWESYDFEGYDVIIHVAAIVHQNESKAGEEIYRKINYEMPLKVANKAKEAGVTQFVFLSTMAVYGNVHGKITENTKVDPCTYYGKYKRLAEIDLLTKNTDSFRVAVVRPPMVYGKGCNGNFARLMRLSKCCSIFPKIENKRSMIYIDNLSEYLYLIIKQKDSGIGCPQNVELVETADLFYQMRKLQNKKTMMTGLGNGIICFLMKRLNVIHKMFGDCYYEISKKEDGWLSIDIEDYQMFSYKDSIEKSLH